MIKEITILLMAYDLFHVTQGAIIKNSEGAVLILGFENGKWLLPGGHVDRGENWEDALRRELKEELGLKNFTIKKIVDITSWTPENHEHSIYALTFLIEASDFKEPILSDEHLKHAWVTLEDLDNYIFIDEVAKNRVLRGLEDKSLF
jgi:nucleoside triphosphatase